MVKLALALLLLFTIAHSLTFERPWYNSTWISTNPNIFDYGIQVWWNIPTLDGSLNSLKLDDVSALQMTGSAKKYVTEAVSSRKTAATDLQDCVQALPLGTSLWASRRGQTARTGISLNFVSALTKIFGCFSYGSAWMYTMDNSLGALEQSADDAQLSIKGGTAAYNDLLFTGLCDESYTHSGNEYCAPMAAILSSAGNGSSYGQLPVLFNYSSQLSGQLLQPAPDMTVFATSMNLVWGEGGIVNTFGKIKTQSILARDEANKEFAALLVSAKARRSEAEKEIAALNHERLDLINGSVSSDVAHSGGTVSGQIISINDREKVLSSSIDSTEVRHGTVGERAYLSDSVIGMDQINQNYSEVLSELNSMLDGATLVVSQERTGSQKELDQTAAYLQSGPQGTEATRLYAQATKAFNSAEKASTLGDSFILYSQAAAFARASRSAPSYSDELSAQSALSELDMLIKNAEKDDVNVAVEKGDLMLLKTLPPYEVQPYAQFSIESIISKAQMMYENDLLASRTSIYDKLSLGGPAISDIYTDLNNYERGIYRQNGSIDYPNAIGRLKQLSSDYYKLEKTLDPYLSRIIGNEMSASATVVSDDVSLDQSVDSRLEIQLSNQRNYSADNVPVSVRLDKPAAFSYGDIVNGSNYVSELSLGKDGRVITLLLPHVGAFDSRTIDLDKQEVVAHTVKTITHAVGIGNGIASVKQDIIFTLDRNIPRLVLPSVGGDAYVDGSTYASGGISAGKHDLSLQYQLVDAYNESDQNLATYGMGTNSHVEYDVAIVPAIDLDSVDVLIDAQNDSRMTSFAIACATGETIKEKNQVSDRQYLVRVLGLQKDRTTVLKVSYAVENTQSYVLDQINLLNGSVLPQNAADALSQAQNQYDAGNYTLALGYAEMAKTLSKSVPKANLVLMQRYSRLRDEATNELSSIQGALSSINTTGPLVDAFSGRVDYLNQELSNSGNMSLSDQVNTLSAIDFKWLEKSINAFKKDSYKQYQILAKQYGVVGNSSLPQELSDFQYAYQQLDSSGSPSDALRLQEELDTIEGLAPGQNTTPDVGMLESSLANVTADIDRLSGNYSAQQSTAKGTTYASLFKENTKTIAVEIRDASAALGKDNATFWTKISELNKSRQAMESTLNTLKKESENRLAILEASLSNSSLDDTTRASLTSKLVAIRQSIDNGNYVGALKDSDGVAKQLASVPKKENNLLLLGITGLAVLATVVVYIAKQQKDKKSSTVPMFRKLAHVEEEKESAKAEKP